MVSIFVCDDEEAWVKIIAKEADCFMFQSEFEVDKVKLFTDPEELFKTRMEHGSDQNIYFIDIDLGAGKMNGLELASRLRKLDESGYIIFVTTYGEMTKKTFEYRVSAFDFICKDEPDLSGRIHDCLKSVEESLKNRSESNPCIFIKHGGMAHRFLFKDIVCIEKVKNTHKLRLHKINGIYEWTGSLSEIEERLPAYFLRGNRGVVINLHHVTDMNFIHRTITLSNTKVCKCSLGEFLRIREHAKV